MFVVRVVFVIEGHIVNKLYNLIMLPLSNKVIIIIFFFLLLLLLLLLLLVVVVVLLL